MKNQMNTQTRQQSFQEICIVDDCDTPRTLTQKVCEKLLPNLSLKLFEDVDHAIQYLVDSPNLNRAIFLDLNMPEKDGWDFLNMYTPQPNEKIFILSSSETEDDKMKALLHPYVAEFISKPISARKVGELFGLNQSSNY